MQRKPCGDLHERSPGRIIAVGIRPPFQDLTGIDDPTWTELCELPGKQHMVKAYWSRKSDERDSMARFGFVGRNGWFQNLIESVESEKE